MREIVTLQLGNLSNHVATHFWNAQESYFTYSDQDKSPINPNVHWRPGIGADGSDTFLPRTVVYDLKGGFGSLSKINALYDAGGDVDAASLWSGPSTAQRATPITRSAYQQSLDAGTEPARLTTSSVRYWSDFSRVYYHPKSLVQLYDFELGSAVMPFERFGMGTELFGTLDKEHDIVDRDWRSFVEECDHMQGIQVFTGLDDAWGGFAASYLEALRDEYPKAPIWTFAMQSPLLDTPREKRQLRLVNAAQALAKMCSHSSTVIPVAIPESGLPKSVVLDRTSTWHVSAAMATAVESVTIPSRLRHEEGPSVSSLGDMAEALNTTGDRPLGSLQMSISPKPRDSPDDKVDHVETLDIDLSHVGSIQTSARERGASKLFSRLAIFRGASLISEDHGHHRARRPLVGESVVRDYETSLAFPMLDSYPTIYQRPTNEPAVEVRTNLSADGTTARLVKAIRAQVTRSIPLDDREDLSNNLAEIADAYMEDYWSGSDEDDDDD